jgi:protein phosphatase
MMMNQPFTLKGDGLTDPGLQRENNEDTWIGPPELSPDIAAQKGYLYIVADGVGGHQGGEIASQIAVQTTRQTYYNDGNPDIGRSLRAAIEEANRNIYHRGISNANEYGMSTTITAAVIRGNELVVANVGDSRAYLIRDGQARQLTSDHTWVEERRQAGILTDEEAANHPRRNVITRSLGGELHVQVDIYPSHPVVPGDQILLCSDGLSDLVNEHEIAEVMNQNPTASSAAAKLVNLAKQRGAPDNVTAVVIRTGRNPVVSKNDSQNLLMLAGAIGGVVLVGGIALVLSRRPTITGPRPRATLEPPVSTPTATITATKTTSPTPPTATSQAPLQLIGPEDGSEFYPYQDVTLSWQGITLKPDQRFYVELRNRNTGQRVPRQLVTEDTEYTLPSLDIADYRWRVRMEEDVEGQWKIISQPSAWRSFRIVPVPPTETPTPTPKPTDTPVPPPSPAPDTGGDSGSEGDDDSGGNNDEPPSKRSS